MKYLKIAADADGTGKSAAEILRGKAVQIDLHGRIIFPDKGFKDWNEMLMAVKIDRIRENLNFMPRNDK